MTPEVMQEYAEALSAFRPVQIQAYAESAYQLARFCASHALKVARPRAIMSSACTLHPHLRETIETVFGAPVFNRYGSREVGDVACECAEHRGLHVPPLTHHVEILRPDLSPCEPGETGEIVVTQLTNAVMPLIRYRIGDMGYWSTEPCGCGRHWPLLGGVTGRSADVLRRRDGGLVDGNYFPHLFKDKVWVESFQVVQEEYEKVKIKIVRAGEAGGPSFDRDGELAAITAAVRQALGPDCAVNYEFVAAIPPTAASSPA
jgi:phenylacetate-CoA ligase